MSFLSLHGRAFTILLWSLYRARWSSTSMCAHARYFGVKYPFKLGHVVFQNKSHTLPLNILICQRKVFWGNVYKSSTFLNQSSCYAAENRHFPFKLNLFFSVSSGNFKNEISTECVSCFETQHSWCEHGV